MNILFVLSSLLLLFNFVNSHVQDPDRTAVFKCVERSFTFLYQEGLHFKEIIDTYESEPSFIVSKNDLASENTRWKLQSWDKSKVRLVLNLKMKDARGLLLGPFKDAPINQNKIQELLDDFAVKTGFALTFAIVPLNTPSKIIKALNSANVKVLKPVAEINHRVDLGTFMFRDIIKVDLLEDGLETIIVLGKHLDRAGDEFFSLNDCLNINITLPRRQQNKTLLDLNSKLTNFRKRNVVEMNYAGELRVSRDNILDKSMEFWKRVGSGAFINRIYISYDGERGVDEGGLYKEWISALVIAGFGLKSEYFNPVQGQGNIFVMPNSNVLPQSEETYLEKYRFLGVFIAKMIINGRNVSCNFPDFILKMMMGRKANFHDLEQIDPVFFNNLKFYADKNMSDDLEGAFDYIRERVDGSKEIIELIPGGSQIEITKDNKYEYMGLRVKAIIDSPQIQSFVKGFRDLLAFNPMPLDIFKPEELRLFITGPVTLDINDWKANTDYEGYYRNSPQIIWFWEVVESMDEEKRRKLLRWATGSSTVPYEGFSALPVNKFGIQRKELNRFRDETNFPRSHTCYNYFDLPEFDTKAVLEQRLFHAIEEEGFGMG